MAIIFRQIINIRLLSIGILLSFVLAGCLQENIPTLSVKIASNPLVLQPGEEASVRLHNPSKQTITWQVSLQQDSNASDWLRFEPSTGTLAEQSYVLLRLSVAETLSDLPQEATVVIEVEGAPSAAVTFGIKVPPNVVDAQ